MQITVNIQRVDVQIHPASSALATLETQTTDAATDELLREIIRLAAARTAAPITEPAAPERGRFRINADGIVLPGGVPGHVAVVDRDTGLMWSITSIGDEDGDPMSHADCAAACTKLDLLGYTDWRLPTRAELATLIDDSRSNPAIDIDLFPGVLPRWHWTSTAAAWSSASAWFVDFSYGGVSYGRRNSNGFALAVRRVGQ